MRTEKSPSRGRVRLGILLATVAAFMLVPAAQAFANGIAKVNIIGSGSGEVISDKFGPEYAGEPPIHCSYTSPGPATGTCETELVEEEFEPGLEAIGLWAEPAPGSEFVAWVVEEGFEAIPCGVNPSCILYQETGGGNALVTAVFECETEGGCGEEATTFPLTVTVEGTGEGNVTSTPAGINCGSECEAEFEEGEEVELSQSAETGSEFVEWGGACTGTGSCEVTMSEAKEVTATFDLEPEPEEFELEINTDGTGEGEVECKVGAGPTEPCEAEYLEGTEVTLVPEAETGSEFVKWSGACTGSGACKLTMNANKSVTATFDEEEPAPEEFDLTIVKAGTGSGSVTCNAGACASTYEKGTELTLAASAASGSTFSGWSGGGCSGTGSCTVTIEEDTTVTATFTANPKPEETCATNASLCPPPPPPAVGTAKTAASATVKSGKASLKLTCTGGPCKGTIQLKAKVKQGKKTKTLVIGKASFSIAEGATTTVKVKLSGPAKQELAKGKTIKAKTSGSGVTASTVKLKQAKKS